MVYLLNLFGGRNKRVDSTASTVYRPIHHANHSYTIVPKTNVNQNEASMFFAKLKIYFNVYLEIIAKKGVCMTIKNMYILNEYIGARNTRIRDKNYRTE